VVRADDNRTVDCRLAAGEELVTPVPARIRECPKRSLLIAHQEHARATYGNSALVARVGVVLCPAYADPSAFEKVALFPAEYRIAYISVAGEHPALAEGCQGECQLCRVKRRSLRTRFGLNDHLVSLHLGQIRGPAMRYRCPWPFWLHWPQRVGHPVVIAGPRPPEL
jgi:hypothetical protein